MTLKELSQLYYLNREIEMDKKRLLELEAKAVSCSSDLSGMPRSPGVGDRVGRYAAEIVDLKGIIAWELRQAGLAEEHIDTLPLCTACHPELYWSHRKMGEARGVQAAMIALR